MIINILILIKTPRNKKMKFDYNFYNQKIIYYYNENINDLIHMENYPFIKTNKNTKKFIIINNFH